MKKKRVLVICTTDSMIYNFLIPHIRQLEQRGNHVICCCSQTGFFFEHLEKEEHIEMIALPFHRTPYHTDNFTAYKQLCKIIKEQRIDCVFCHEPVGGVIGRLAAAKTKIPAIYCAHGFHFFNGAPRKSWLLYYTVEKYLSRFTHSLITINQEDYACASNKMHAKHTYLINGIGVNIEKFACDSISEEQKEALRQELGISSDTKVLLSVGELSLRKNYSELVDALQKITYKNYVCLIVGSGDEHNNLQQQIQEGGLEGKVRLLGYRRDIAVLNALCDLYVFVTKQEGLPMAIMEAMAAGNCVVASNVRGNIDLIQHEKGGLVYPLHDVQTLAQYIDRALEDPDFRSSCGAFNREFVKRFNLQTVCEQMESIYDKLN